VLTDSPFEGDVIETLCHIFALECSSEQSDSLKLPKSSTACLIFSINLRAFFKSLLCGNFKLVPLFFYVSYRISGLVENILPF
jgi:hypothetical protein